nr:protein CNGC15b-like [Nicotiana tomentosiformis]
MLYMLASHVLEACWYLLSIERQEACWKYACSLEKSSCDYGYFDCQRVKDPQRNAWFNSSNITRQCDRNNNNYLFGISGDTVAISVTSALFFSKYYCYTGP